MLRTDLAREIEKRSGENVFLCYQCKKCTAGCPVAAYFDVKPHQVMRACQFGEADLVLHSRTVSVCAACETCSTRCPQGIDVARVMDELEIMAQEKGIKSKAPTVPMFYRSANRGINWFGRMYELGLMAELYVREFFGRQLNFQQLLKYDIPMAVKMFRGGKLNIVPSMARRPRNRHKPEPVEADVVSYYPGCSLHATGKEFDMSTRAVVEKLGLKLVEPEGWVCCGTSPAHNTNYYRSVNLPMQTLAIAQQMGHTYMTMPCAACFSRFRFAMHEVQNNAELLAKVEKDVGFRYKGGIQVDNLLTTITDRVGYEAAAKPVVRRLKGLKVACYYGCLLTRPPEVTGEVHYEYPVNMDRLMQVLGAQPVEWGYKTECCGGSLSLSTLEIALDLSHKILEGAKAAGADMIVTACPLCHVNLDARQAQIKDQFKWAFSIPVVYFTQLMGVAYGLHAKPLGLDKHLTDAVGFLKGRKLLYA